VPYLIAYISSIMSLEPGDIIATGTPEGVGPLADGDTVRVEITQVGRVENAVRRRITETS
jgi:2-keto-4-pentenoate hydratase/2-oxohepta-3-ene-1,7-dioic acid hydratase in catechol pathway